MADLRASVDEVRREPAGEGGMAPVYGMAAQMPDRGAVAAMLEASWTCGSARDSSRGDPGRVRERRPA